MASAIETTEEWEIPTGSFHAHFDCFSGAAGDMMLAATLDASGDEKTAKLLLRHVEGCIARGLPELAGDFSIETRMVWRSKTGSIAANYVLVKSRYQHAPAPVPKPKDQTELVKQKTATTEPIDHSHGHDHGHDHGHQNEHDHAHKHKHSHSHQNEHGHGHQHGHSHAHKHEHGHSENGHHDGEAKGGKDRDRDTTSDDSHSHNHAHAHSHGHSHSHGHGHGETDGGKGPLRNLPEIRKMLETADESYIPEWVKVHSLAAFTELAKAEAATHGADSMDAVHFHEVGAIDSIVDTVGTVLALYCLGVKTVSCSRLPLGEGTVWTDHGLLPVPAPATLRLLSGMLTCPGPPGITGELVTPTAAALLKVLSTNGHERIAGRAPCFTIRKIGIGAGTKDFVKHPNILRVIIGDQVVRSHQV